MMELSSFRGRSSAASLKPRERDAGAATGRDAARMRALAATLTGRAAKLR